MKNKLNDLISDSVKHLFKSWPLKPEVEVKNEDGVVRVEIRTGKDHLFIQPSADPLLALQHILRLIVKKQFPEEDIKLTVNIGDFHKQQEVKLRDIANSAIERVKTSGHPVHLPPMSSFERRVVHTVVGEHEQVASESAGIGPTRHVVVKLTD